jgi:hypothetical protein
VQSFVSASLTSSFRLGFDCFKSNDVPRQEAFGFADVVTPLRIWDLATLVGFPDFGFSVLVLFRIISIVNLEI